MIRKIKRFIEFEKLRKQPERQPIYSYSQDGEDMVLRALLEESKIETGFFVDIGALHPFRFSNTAHFYRDGWKGINIEPTPSSFTLFEQHRKRDINLNIGIGQEHDELTFYCFNEPAFNTFDKELSEERALIPGYHIIDTTPVKVYPLAEVLDKHVPQGTHINFMTIDAEGLDYKILLSNNWDKYCPDFILAEDVIEFDNLNKSEIYQLLTSKGYQLAAKTFRTLIFKRKDV